MSGFTGPAAEETKEQRPMEPRDGAGNSCLLTPLPPTHAAEQDPRDEGAKQLLCRLGEKGRWGGHPGTRGNACMVQPGRKRIPLGWGKWCEACEGGDERRCPESISSWRGETRAGPGSRKHFLFRRGDSSQHLSYLPQPLLPTPYQSWFGVGTLLLRHS